MHRGPRLVVQKNGDSDDHFGLGADEPGVVAGLNDPDRSQCLARFTSDRIDGVFLVTGSDQKFVETRSQELLNQLGGSIAVVYSEIGNVSQTLQKGTSISASSTASRSRASAASHHARILRSTGSGTCLARI